MDPVSILGLLLGLAAILLGHILESGHAGSIFQPTAAIIVLGGTTGATLFSAVRTDLAQGLRLAANAFRKPPRPERRILRDFAQMAEIARKEGIVALEERYESHPDPLFRFALQQIVDGTRPQLMREMLGTEAETRYEKVRNGIRVFEMAGGYAPTIGIIGAVLGLIQVMENLDDPSELGAGIAVAFVATIYGVGLANMVLLPIAAKLRRLAAHQRACDEMVIEGALSIVSGQSPRAVQDRLSCFLSTR
jgi:chemotaxis protein MotA